MKAFIFGKIKNFFNNELKNKVKYQNFDKLSNAVKGVFNLIKREEKSLICLVHVQHHLIALKILKIENTILIN